MKLDFRQRLLTTTLLVGAGMFATPALAQATSATPPECPPGTVPGGSGACQAADTAQGTGTQPETTTPIEGTTVVPSTSASGEPVKSAQDIVITGTRIPQPNLTSASPVTVLSSQEVKLQGTSRTEDLINSLPQSFAAQGSNISNGASGTATVNLRNLGASRTVVLINGRRLMAGDNNSPYPDLNFIPTQLIKRVDVLTGGASSTYGADAVGGVVNFIMDNTFTGVRIDAQASAFMHDNRDNGSVRLANELRGFQPPKGLSVNGGAADIAGVIGAAFDDGRGHVQAYATYRRQRAVTQATRDYSFCALSARSKSQVAANPSRRYSCGGSYTSATGTFVQFDPTTFATVGTFEVQGNQFTPGYTLFNYGPYNYYQRPDERYNLGAFADYEISPGFKPYLEAMFMDDKSNAVIAPSGNFGSSLYLGCNNPLLSAQQVATICGDPALTFIDPATGDQTAIVQILRRNVEGGGRENVIQHTDFRIVAGMRGDVMRGVSYDASYQFGRVNRQGTDLNYFDTTKIAKSIDVIADPVTGLPVCRSVVNGTDPDCIPYNIFTTGGVTQASLNYLQTPALQAGTLNESIAHADVTVDGAQYGMKTPWAENGFGFNFGAEYRKEQSDFRPDAVYQAGILAGAGGKTKPVKGEFDVREVFAEVQLPLVEHNFIDLLQFTAGYRYSNYKVGSNSFNTKTYKAGVEFAPIKDVRFRASYNRAVRAPNIVELFYPQNVQLAGTVDPCTGDFDPATAAEPPTATLAQCVATGLPAAQYGNLKGDPANQYQGLVGGNPNLQPEKADSYTAGVIVQPRFIPGLALTADYFNIKVKNVIGSDVYGSVFTDCFAGDAARCALIHRDKFGSLFRTEDGYVTVLNKNFSGVGLSTKGWDFSGSYSRRLGGFGTLNASFVSTLQGKTATVGGAGTGKFSADSYPVTKFRSKARLGMALPNGLGISGSWRHFSRVTLGDPTITQPANQVIKAQNYFDLAMTARITNKFNLRFGANNILDKSPPLLGGQVCPAGFCNGNTYPQIYDSLGRYMFAGVTVDF